MIPELDSCRVITSFETYIPIRIPGYPLLRNAQHIVRLEGARNYTIVHLKDGQKPLLVSCTLKWFEQKIPTFIRVNKSVVVNPRYISGIIKVAKTKVYTRLISGDLLLISKRRIPLTVSRLEKFPLTNLSYS